jgi:GMP synthase (glutamine-hydrolysing)
MNSHRNEMSSLRPVLSIINQSDAHLGVFKPLLAEFGISVVEVRAEAGLNSIDLDDIGGLVSLGGAMGVHDAKRYPWLAEEVRLLGSAHERGVPVLGVCLGGQLLAQSLGGRVYPGRRGEIGWLEVTHFVDDPVLGPPGGRRQFQWHFDSFDTPPGAERIAGSAACPDQAFRAGRSYGVQFHPEVSTELLTEWVTSDDGRIQLIENGVDPDKLMVEGAEMESLYERQARTMTEGFARLVADRR